MPTIVAITVVALWTIEVAVFVTTFWTPPMSFEIRDCTSPVRVRVKNASESRCRCLKTAVRRSCMTRWPTWFESSVWITPSTPTAIAIPMIAAELIESSRVSFAPIASRTRLSRNAGSTPSAAVKTISPRTPLSRSLYGAKRRPMRRRFERRTAGSAGRSGISSEAWKNMPTGSGYAADTRRPRRAQAKSPAEAGRSAAYRWPSARERRADVDERSRIADGRHVPVGIELGAHLAALVPDARFAGDGIREPRPVSGHLGRGRAVGVAPQLERPGRGARDRPVRVEVRQRQCVAREDSEQLPVVARPVGERRVDLIALEVGSNRE